jgi:hypothetical protein
MQKKGTTGNQAQILTYNSFLFHIQYQSYADNLLDMLSKNKQWDFLNCEKDLVQGKGFLY